MRKLTLLLAVQFAASVSQAGDDEIELDRNFFLTTLFIDTCYEYHHFHEKPCPDGYARVVVNTPSSDAKSWCKESFGAVIECGRVVPPTLEPGERSEHD